MLGEEVTKLAKESWQKVGLPVVRDVASISPAHLLPHNAVHFEGASVDGGALIGGFPQPDQGARRPPLEGFAHASDGALEFIQVLVPLLMGCLVQALGVEGMDGLIPGNGMLKEEGLLCVAGGGVSEGSIHVRTSGGGHGFREAMEKTSWVHDFAGREGKNVGSSARMLAVVRLMSVSRTFM